MTLARVQTKQILIYEKKIFLQQKSFRKLADFTAGVEHSVTMYLGGGQRGWGWVILNKLVQQNLNFGRSF